MIYKILNIRASLTLLLLFLILIIFSCSSRKINQFKSFILVDSIAMKVPIELYNNDLGAPDFKLNLDEKIAYFFSIDDKKLISYDIVKDTFKTFNCELTEDRQHLFHFSVVDSNHFVLYFNTFYFKGFFDHTFYNLTRDTIQQIQMNFEGLDIRTSNNFPEINTWTSTYLEPVRLEPIIMEDSSIIVSCHYYFVPGTTNYANINKGQFVHLFPKNSQKKGYYLPIKFSDFIENNEYFARAYAQTFGFRKGDSMVFSFGISNDIYFYNLNTKSLTIKKQDKPLVERVNSSDTIFDSYNDYDQHRFMYFLFNPYQNQYYRIIKLSDEKGYYLIQMDSNFNEIGLYKIPNNIQWPFHISKDGIYGYKKLSYDLTGRYIFYNFRL